MIPLYPLRTVTIILIDIAFKNYSIDSVIRHLKSSSFSGICFFCKCRKIKIHGTYRKYFYQTLIPILRVKCEVCGKTHALMPSFSLPGTSIGTDAASKVLLQFSQGKSLYMITRELFPQTTESGYIRQFNNSLQSRILQAKALFPDIGDHTLLGLDWIKSVLGLHANPILAFNQFCLTVSINCLFCTQTRFLGIRRYKPRYCYSHNSTATGFT